MKKRADLLHGLRPSWAGSGLCSHYNRAWKTFGNGERMRGLRGEGEVVRRQSLNVGVIKKGVGGRLRLRPLAF